MQWNPEEYNKNAEVLPRESDIRLFMGTVLEKMSWKEDDIVMDIGCGSGDVTRNRLLPQIPKLKLFLGVDVSLEMIEHAKANFSSEKIEYHVADMEDRTTFPPEWQGTISKVISIKCFHFMKNQTAGFQNMFDLMSSEGEAAVLFVTSTPFWDFRNELAKKQKWEAFTKKVEWCAPISHTLGLKSEHYRKMLEEIGFLVLLCKEEKRTHVFQNDLRYKYFFSLFCVWTPYIPEHLREEFREEVFQGALKHNGRNSDGKPLFHYTTLTVLLKKP